MAALAPMAFRAAMPMMMRAAASPGVRKAFTGLGQNGSILQSLSGLGTDSVSSGINNALQNGSLMNMWQKLASPTPPYISTLPGATQDTMSIPAPLYDSVPQARSYSYPGNNQSSCRNCCDRCTCCSRQIRGGTRIKKRHKQHRKRKTGRRS
jgi:hypothetical protein